MGDAHVGPILTVITVTWNVKQLLRKSICSAQRSIGTMSYEYIVVDNGSSDGTLAMLEQEFPEVIVIRNQENIGFGRANNQGIRRSKGLYIVFLNPDTEVLDTALEVMVHIMERDSTIGVLGCKLLNANLEWSREMGYRFATARTVINDFLLLNRLLPFPKLMPGIVRSQDFEGIVECDWVCGACFMVCREVAEQERWNEGIFMYAEEMDYCHRIMQHGWRICCTGDAKVMHYSGQSLLKQPVDVLAGKPSALWGFLLEHEGLTSACIGFGAMWLGIRLRRVYHLAAYYLTRDITHLHKSSRLSQLLKVRPGGRLSAGEGSWENKNGS